MAKVLKKKKVILTSKDAATLLYKLRSEGYNKILTVEFYKKNTDEYRVMTGRFGVKKGVKGVGLSFDPAAKDLIGFYDVTVLPKSEEEKAARGGFRFIYWPGIRAITKNGKRQAYVEFKNVQVEAK